MTIAHTLLMFVLPFACDFGLAWLIRPSRWYQHVAAFVAAAGLSIGLAYCGFLIVIGVTTGSWPQEISIGELASALVWFAIPGWFTIGPAAAAGYIGGILAGRSTTRRPVGERRAC